MRLAFVLLVFASCSTQIDVTHYSQACTAATDCAAVFTGDTCAVCVCPNAAVSRQDLARYTADADALRVRCGPRPEARCGACMMRDVQCANGNCQLQP